MRFYWLKFLNQCGVIFKIIFPLPNRKKSIIFNIRSLIESVVSFFIIMYCLIFFFTPYSTDLDACSSSYFYEREVTFQCEDVVVKVVSNQLVFSALSFSLNFDVLGVNTFFNTIFINKNSAEKLEQKINDILKHELEHSAQKEELGVIGFLLAPKWLIEGTADFIRGKPTVDICTGLKSWGDGTSKQFYFESWAKVTYLIQVKGVRFADLLKTDIQALESEDVVKNKIFKLYCILES